MFLEEKSGNRYGKLTVLKDAGIKKTKSGNRIHIILCKCDCGNIKEIRLPDAKSGKINSCGCIAKQKIAELGKKNKRGNPKHNLYYSKQYKIYHNIKSKIKNRNNKKYKYCGAVGVKMCKEWENDFIVFYDWTIKNGFNEQKNSIKRIDPNGDFSPQNCIVCTENEGKKNIWNKKAKIGIYEGAKKWHKEHKDYWKGTVMKKILQTRLKKYGSLCVNTREGCSWKAGWREIGGKRKYFRSKWEANYARYLEWLKEHNQIKDWQHENKTFWFEGIKRGCRSYLPDFEVENNNGSIEYHEVKGWYDDRSKTKMKRMAKYYPEVKVIIIFQKQYTEIKNKVGKLIRDWE